MQLNPALDDDGILRLRGWQRNATMLQEDTKFPLILKSKHLFVHLTIDHYHQKTSHSGNKFVVNELLSYWILQLCSAVRSA